MKLQQEQAADSEDSQSISQKIEALSFAIRKANIKKEEIAMNTAHIQESAAFRRLQDDPTIARNDEGIWAEVEAVINETYPGFTDRLRLLLPKMSGKEWQVSLLLKAQLTHQLIAEIICETPGRRVEYPPKAQQEALPLRNAVVFKIRRFHREFVAVCVLFASQTKRSSPKTVK